MEISKLMSNLSSNEQKTAIIFWYIRWQKWHKAHIELARNQLKLKLVFIRSSTNIPVKKFGQVRTGVISTRSYWRNSGSEAHRYIGWDNLKLYIHILDFDLFYLHEYHPFVLSECSTINCGNIVVLQVSETDQTKFWHESSVHKNSSKVQKQIEREE